MLSQESQRNTLKATWKEGFLLTF